MTIYFVSPLAQEYEVTAYCLNKCKNIGMAIITITTDGSFLPCKQENCPYVDESIVLNDEITVRKLKPVSKHDSQV